MQGRTYKWRWKAAGAVLILVLLISAPFW